MVIATQNPVEHEGTYPLPESQLDRFLMRISVGYPGRGAELDVLLWELTGRWEEHRRVCTHERPCPLLREAIAVVLEWREARSLLSRAEALRIERTLFEAAA